ncbi:hypothetical protein DDI_4283 [Dickeya dianthicola RNS04.9]|nr:hypothetical protein DDI_4283 [Dickeya dianthicola RNS04.9]
MLFDVFCSDTDNYRRFIRQFLFGTDICLTIFASEINFTEQSFY